MTPREWYESRASKWLAASDEAGARALAMSRFRLTAFFAAVVLLWWGLEAAHVGAVALGIVAVVSFGVLVARHARILEAQDRAEAGRASARQGLARIDRDWRSLPEVASPADLDEDTHPYARDLDLFGHASLAQWLGAAATSNGGALLATWLLQAAPLESIRERQAAVAELAADREWRESLAVEGRLCPEDEGALARFLAWAVDAKPAVPPALHVVVPVLALFIWVLIAAQAGGLVDRPWWLIPVVPGVVLSFAFARPIYAAFGRASAGERVLRRYAAMLALVCAANRTSVRLRQLRDRVGADCGAPRAVARLARLIEWSEMRRSSALLHIPVQALTLWDFHVLFAIERWRSRFGGCINGWLGALAEIDALSILAAVAHDEPEWCMAALDDGAKTYAARALAHPLLPATRRVANDVEVGPAGTLLLVTGSNMSGKSTLLRAIGLNAVLAQAGAPACAAALTMPPIELQTSIRVQDSLERGLSYFMAALATLKRVVDAAESRSPGTRVMLYLLDEVLQGTNSAERALAVRGVARHLLNAGAIGAMTTHDLSMAREEPLSSAAHLVHFTEQVHEDGTMTFDYRLRPGLAVSKNAIRLMQLIGIQP